MRKLTSLSCLALLCLLAVGVAPPAEAAGRGDSTRADADAFAAWRAEVRLERQIARLFGLLPFAPPDALAPSGRDDDGPVRGGLGLSDDPDPTGSRGDGGGGERDDDEDSVTSGDQPMSTDEDSVRQIGQR